jgi:hypothetical protein
LSCSCLHENKKQARNAVTAMDGGNADIVWNKYLPITLYIPISQSRKEKKNMYHSGTENTECNYSKAFTILLTSLKT